MSGTVKLNNYLQAKGRPNALTWVEMTKGPEHAPKWICECTVGGKSYATGEGTTKQAARNVAANVALARIQQEGDGDVVPHK